MQIYEADRHMRHIILLTAEAVEIRIKSMVAYYHSKEYGPLGEGHVLINTHYRGSLPLQLKVV